MYVCSHVFVYIYKYVFIIMQAQSGAFGRDLDDGKKSKLNQEQIENLQRLEEEARKIGSGEA
jgi:hypothetical protein